MRIGRKKQRENALVAHFAMERVSVESPIRKKDFILVVMVQMILSLLCTYSTLFMMSDCIAVKYNTIIFGIVSVVTQLIIYSAVYMYGCKGKRRYVSIIMGVYVCTILVLRKVIMEGLLQVVKGYIGSFNKYYKGEYYLDFTPKYSQVTSVTIFLIVAAILISIIVDYVVVCQKAKIVYELITISMIVVCLIAGIRPATVPFIIYIITHMAISASVIFKKTSSPAGRYVKNLFQEKYVDVSIAKVIIGTSVCTILIMILVAVTLPRDYYDHNSMKQRHKDYVAKTNEKVEEKKKRYQYDTTFFDTLLGIESDLGANERIYGKGSSIADILGKDAYKFYGGFCHGKLQDYKGQAAISKDKMMDLYFDENFQDINCLYLKTYQSCYYKNGKWFNFDEYGYPCDEDYTDELLNNNIQNDYRLNEHYSVRIKKAGPQTEDILLPYYGSKISEDGNGMVYKIKKSNVFNNIYAPGQIKEMNEGEVYIKDTISDDYIRSDFFSNKADDDEDEDTLYGDMMITESVYDIDYGETSSLYSFYTKVPDECKKIAQESEQVAVELGLDIETTFGEYSEESFYDNYIETVKALDYVVGRLSSGDYVYTLSPKIDNAYDPIEYFLYESKEGYCMHFASAAVLMLRGMGVPARYVEGYAVPTNYVTPDNKSVPVYGTNVHAWIEVYIKGIGWVPQEMTLGKTKDGSTFLDEARKQQNPETDNPSSSKNPSASKRPDQTKSPEQTKSPKVTKQPDKSKDSKVTKQPDDTGDSQSGKDDNNAARILNQNLIIVLIICSIIFVIVTAICVVAMHDKKIRKMVATRRGCYRYIVNFFDSQAKSMGIVYGNDMSYTSYAELFADKTEFISYEEMLKMMKIRVRLKFSLDTLTDEDCKVLKEVYNSYMENARKNWNPVKRFVYVKLRGTLIQIK